MRMRVLTHLCLTLTAALWLATVRADIPQDIPQLEENPSAQPESELLLTNTADLVGLFLEGYDYPIGSWAWPPGTFVQVLFQPMTIVWADTANLSTGLAGITNFVPTSLEGVKAWPLWVTLWPQSNTVTVLQPWSADILTGFPVPDGFPSWQVYEANLYPACVLLGINYTNWETLVEEGYTQFSVPQVITHAWLMDVGSRDAYLNNCEADYEAAEAAQAVTASAASFTGGFSPMDDDGGGGDLCTLTNLLQPFSVTKITQTASGTSITFPSFQFFRYLIWEANVLSTNTQWLPVAYVWGQPNQCSTTWTDTSTTNTDGSAVTQRFYKVQRLLGSPIAAGGESSVAITQDGRLWAWGTSDGELGDGLDIGSSGPDGHHVETYLPYPSDVANAASCGIQSITNAIAVAAGGDDYTVVVDSTGTVWTFGENDGAQLGNASESRGEYTMYPVPAPITGVPGFTNIISVAAGYQHTLALRADGTVWAWGNDTYGQGSGALGAGYPVYYTNSPIQSLIPAGTNIVAIAAGNAFSLALDATGLVWGWGDNSDGEIGPWAGGGTYSPEPILYTSLSNVIAIAAGDNFFAGTGGGGHSVALTAGGWVYTWGDNNFGALGLGIWGGTYNTPGLVTALTNQYIVAIAAGVGFTLAVTSNGQVYAWGDNEFGELGTNSSAVLFTNSPMLVSGISNAVWVSAPRSDDALNPAMTNQNYCGGQHALVMTLDPVDGTGQMTNHYWGWGDNSYGQIGAGTNGGGVSQVSQYSPAGPLQFCTRCQREVQLGTSGIFTAQCNGTLCLYFNTDNFNYGFPNGSYSATILGSNSTVICSNVTVLATNFQGVAAGPVTIGNVYTFNASGYCVYDSFGHQSDPDGRDSISNDLVVCSSSLLNVTNSVCPWLQCFSLVGKIQ